MLTGSDYQRKFSRHPEGSSADQLPDYDCNDTPQLWQKRKYCKNPGNIIGSIDFAFSNDEL